MTKKLSEGISQLSVERRIIIAELLAKAAMLINSVEMELLETELQHHSLLDGKEHPSLWCQIYALEKMFGNDYQF